MLKMLKITVVALHYFHTWLKAWLMTWQNIYSRTSQNFVPNPIQVILYEIDRDSSLDDGLIMRTGKAWLFLFCMQSRFKRLDEH